MAHYLICYDIADPRRLRRLHRFLRARAVPIQYSVFLFHGDRRAADALMDEAARLIDDKRDDLRCYRLPRRGFAARLGAAVLPEGIHLTSLPAPLLPDWDLAQRQARPPGPPDEATADSPGGGPSRSGGDRLPSTPPAHASSGRPPRKPRPRPLRARGTYVLR